MFPGLVFPHSLGLGAISKRAKHAMCVTDRSHLSQRIIPISVLDMLRTTTQRSYDAEQGEVASERTAVQSNYLQEESSNTQRKRESRCICTPQLFGGGIYLPDPSTYDPIEILLNTEDDKDRDELTMRWRDNKLSELNFVGVVAALLAGVLTSTGSWPTILPSGMPSPWPVRTSWYCGIILSLLSIISAADQTVRLHRLSSHRDGLSNIRKLLAKGSRTTKIGRRAPSLTQIMAWQTPVMFLITATICMVVGMFLLVWSATANVISPGLWDDQLKVAIVYTTVAVFAFIIFFVGQITLYSPIRD